MGDSIIAIFNDDQQDLKTALEQVVLSSNPEPEFNSEFRELKLKKLISLGEVVRTQDLRTITDYLCKQENMSEFVDSLSNDDDEEEFQRHKNKLITLITKNNNIQTKYSRRKFYQNIMFGLMLILVIGFSFLYLSGKNDKNMLQTSYVLMISLSLGMIVLFVIYEVYIMLSKKSSLIIEEFNTPCPYSGIQSPEDLNENLLIFLESLDENLMKAKDVLSYTSGKKSEIVKGILHDYNNMNYVNMRKYQITDYRLQESRSRIHFMKYGFLIISIIGILGGLSLRSQDETIGQSFTIPTDMFIGTSVLLVVSYLTVYLLHQKQNMIRKKYNWDKLYWNIKAISDTQNNE